MSSSQEPPLTQFAEEPRPCDVSWDLVCDPATGLLFRKGSSTPVIEEILQRRVDGLSAMGTFVTRTPEPVDPDLVRTASPSYLRLESLLTRAKGGAGGS
jgi:hypothetical protein